MKKQTNLNQKAFWLFAAFLFATLSFVAEAQDAAKLKVGDRVENADLDRKGTITEIGTGSYEGCYRFRSDNQSNSNYKGDFVCTFGQLGHLYLIDAKGNRVRDINAPVDTAQNNQNKQPQEEQTTTDEKQVGQNDQTGDFKNGDRVEGRIGSTWYKCTVEGARRPTGGYVLRCDNKPLEEIVFAASYVRAMQSPDTDGGKKIAEEAQKTVKQAIAQCSGDPLLNLRTKGRAASAALFGEVIKSMFDKEGRGEKRIHKVVTQITKLEAGKPYRWTPGSDWQRLGQAKTVYPVKATFITCDDGVYDWGVAEYQNYNYTCYVDETRNGEWSCGVNESGKIKSQLIPKQSQNDLFTGRPPKP